MSQDASGALTRWSRIPAWIRVVIVVAVVVAVLAAIVGIKSAMTKKTFNVQGYLQLNTGVEVQGTTCSGSGGFADIQPGAQVVIRDASDKSIAVTSLGGGYPQKDGSCRLLFMNPDTPEDGDVYSIEVSHRGAISFTKEQASEVAITLG